MVLANAYHLMLRPGAATVAALGGLHRFTGWDGHTLTDSGGFQVHSLRPKVDDDGVTFASVYDGAATRLTPETAVEVQGLLGADIQMVLDVCASLPATPDVLRVAVDRTADWAARARAHHDRVEARPEGQALFGIVQGGTDAALRVESARRTVALDFDGYGIGGPVGGGAAPRAARGPGRDRARAAHRPAALSDGRGGPGRACSSRSPWAWTSSTASPRPGRPGTARCGPPTGRLNLRNAANAADDGPIDPDCPCSTCARWSRGYLRHLQSMGEPTAWRLCSIHNLAYVLGLMDRARAAIATGTLSDLVDGHAGGLGPLGTGGPRHRGWSTYRRTALGYSRCAVTTPTPFPIPR